MNIAKENPSDDAWVTSKTIPFLGFPWYKNHSKKKQDKITRVCFTAI